MAPEVPGYEVLGLLGQGGFGVVYQARQLAVGREVALKVDSRVLVSERDQRRFMREVTSAGALSGHPHVAAVYDAGVLRDGRPYMVLELCPGGSLSDRMRSGVLPVAEVRDVGVRIADALAAAHAAGVLHRDVKPANILINRYGHVVLSDFGLATMPEPGAEVSVTRESLTPAYAPPEAFELTEPSAAGDVYSLSATLYALLSGRPPRFPESGVANLAVIMALHRQPVPEIPGVPAAFTEVLRQALATDPSRRTPSAAAFRDALAALSPDAFLGGGAGSVAESGGWGTGGAASPSQGGFPLTGPEADRPGFGGWPAESTGPQGGWQAVQTGAGQAAAWSHAPTGPGHAGPQPGGWAGAPTGPGHAAPGHMPPGPVPPGHVAPEHAGKAPMGGWGAAPTGPGHGLGHPGGWVGAPGGDLHGAPTALSRRAATRGYATASALFAVMIAVGVVLMILEGR
ncbi:protein kinase domain-containing protein [Nonomuraea sp. bgisy101]|uniref:serine/threonine-protein kinase n=1 Tax=Nonomuraea sp. bgisy101 TaxID=3413784 RepID=UPI003D753061